MDETEKKTSTQEIPVAWVRRMVVLRRSSIWQPATDAYETADKLTIVVELAGMKAGEFNVSLSGQRLIISGNRSRPVETSGSIAYHQMEVQYGEFRTEVAVPWAVDSAQISATYQDGFLRVELPRLQQTHTVHVVEVKQEDTERSDDT